jgi:hypothetical protein
MGKKRRAEEEALLASMKSGVEDATGISDEGVSSVESGEAVAGAEILEVEASAQPEVPAEFSSEPAAKGITLAERKVPTAEAEKEATEVSLEDIWEQLPIADAQELEEIGSPFYVAEKIFSNNDGCVLFIREARMYEGQVYFAIEVRSLIDSPQIVAGLSVENLQEELANEGFHEVDEPISTEGLVSKKAKALLASEESLNKEQNEEVIKPVKTISSFGDLPDILLSENLSAQGTFKESDFARLVEKLNPETGAKERSGEIVKEEHKAAEKESTEKEVSPGQVYSYRDSHTNTIRYIAITNCSEKRISYQEYNAETGKWGSEKTISRVQMNKYRREGYAKKEAYTTEDAARVAERRWMDYCIAKEIAFVIRESQPDNDLEQGAPMRIESYFERTKALSITPTNPEIKDRKHISLEGFREEYRRVKTKKKRAPKENVEQGIAVAEGETKAITPKPETPASADIALEAGREKVVQELQTLVGTLKEVKYYGILDQDIIMANTNGSSRLTRDHFDILDSTDTQALYEKMKQKVDIDFAPKIFTKYQDGALRLWGLQRFIENEEVKFLTHIFEIKDFFDLPKQNLSEALQLLQGDLALADNDDWQIIFGIAMQDLADKNVPEWMKRIDAAQEVSGAKEE